MGYKHVWLYQSSTAAHSLDLFRLRSLDPTQKSLRTHQGLVCKRNLDQSMAVGYIALVMACTSTK